MLEANLLSTSKNRTNLSTNQSIALGRPKNQTFPQIKDAFPWSCSGLRRSTDIWGKPCHFKQVLQNRLLLFNQNHACNSFLNQQLLQEIISTNQMNRQLLATLANYGTPLPAGKRMVKKQHSIRNNHCYNAQTRLAMLSQW